jgi:hypothetical protein
LRKVPGWSNESSSGKPPLRVPVGLSSFNDLFLRYSRTSLSPALGPYCCCSCCCSAARRWALVVSHWESRGSRGAGGGGGGGWWWRWGGTSERGDGQRQGASACAGVHACSAATEYVGATPLVTHKKVVGAHACCCLGVWRWAAAMGSKQVGAMCVADCRQPKSLLDDV